jgi:hypothetical protein
MVEAHALLSQQLLERTSLRVGARISVENESARHIILVEPVGKYPGDDLVRDEFTRSPTGVLAATAARSMSPVESWTIWRSRTSRSACVPFPAPGGPNRMMFTF